LVHRARPLCDKESLHDELEFLKSTFRENRYSLGQILCTDSENIKAQRYTHLSHSPAICPEDIWLPQQNVDLLPRKFSNFFCLVKYNLGLRTPGVYIISCKCGQVYIEKTDRSVGYCGIVK